MMENTVNVICPHCQEPSDSIKRMQTWFVLCLLFAAWFRTETMTACPSCIRKQLGKNALINILTANLIWPVLILPHTLIQLLRTYQKGHHPEIQASLDNAEKRKAMPRI